MSQGDGSASEKEDGTAAAPEPCPAVVPEPPAAALDGGAPAGGGLGLPWLAAGVSFLAALGLAVVAARAAHPAIIFPKYLAAAVAPRAEQAERLLDYSPLYLALVRLLLPWGPAGILAFQAALHGVVAAGVAMAVGLLAGRRWPAWVGGIGVAAYRPFLVYSGVHEPETVILACLTVAIVGGLLARARLRAAGGADDARPQAAPAAAASVEIRRCSAPRSPGLLVTILAAFAALAAAALGRPQFAVLVPVWAWWIAGAAPRTRRQAVNARLWAAAAAACLTVLGPPVWARARATGWPTIMNPGAVFYEGNGPGATGLTRFAPPAVIALERAHRESIDYGHVAYRRIAALALGAGKPLDLAASGGHRPILAAGGGHPPIQAVTGGARRLSVAAVNRYWSGLAWEGMAARPGDAVRRFGRKALMAVMPYEGHDLLVAERLDRGLRGWLPWGFGLPLLALPWVALARRRRLAELAGPLGLAALAAAVQVATYASARQRLPLALALWVAMPVLLADLAGGRLRPIVRPALAALAAAALALGLAAATARVATLDQAGWDVLLGSRPPLPGERLAALLDGSALRPRLRLAAERLAAAADLAHRRRPAASLAVLAPLLGAGADLTSDDRNIGVPEHWAALDLLALGDRPHAAAAAAVAAAIRPADARLAALALQLAASSGTSFGATVGTSSGTSAGTSAGISAGAPPRGGAWRPPGCDPVSARLALAAAAAADHDRGAWAAAQAPLGTELPELVPGRPASPAKASGAAGWNAVSRWTAATTANPAAPRTYHAGRRGLAGRSEGGV